MTLIKNRVIERKELDEEFESELRGHVESVKTAGLPDLFLPSDKEVGRCIASATSAKKVAEDQRKVSLEPAVGDKRSAPDAPDAYEDNGCQGRGKGEAAAGPKLADISSNVVAPPPPPPTPAPPPQPPPLPAEEERKSQEDEASKRQGGQAARRSLATSNAAAAGKDRVDAASALRRKMKKRDGDENGQGISHLRAGLRVSPCLFPLACFPLLVSACLFPLVCFPFSFSLPCGGMCSIFVRLMSIVSNETHRLSMVLISLLFCILFQVHQVCI